MIVVMEDVISATKSIIISITKSFFFVVSCIDSKTIGNMYIKAAIPLKSVTETTHKLMDINRTFNAEKI